MVDELVERVLSDPDNDLAEIVRSFQQCDESYQSLDRHVLGVSDGSPVPPELVEAACAAALALARHWTRQSSALAEPGIWISKPFVLIDDPWLAGERNAPPPHVYLWLALDEKSPEPYRPEGAPRSSSGIPAVDALLGGGERLQRIEGEPEGPGAWVIEIFDGDSR